MLDLDTQAQSFSEIWGWRIRIGDFFSADYTPVPFQFLWRKMRHEPNAPFSNRIAGAAYQSVLTNISWIDSKSESPFIKQLRRAMHNHNIDSEKLSIRFNGDKYQTDSKDSMFSLGRVTGTLLQLI